MLAPALGRAREGVRRAQCANNLRQQGIAWHLYLDDHDDTFPSYTSGLHISYGGKKGEWVPTYAKYRILNPYLGIDVSKPQDEVEKDPSLEIFHCPGDSAIYSNFNYRYGNSYMTNSQLLTFGAPNAGPRPLSSVTAPYSKLTLATEPYTYHNRAWRADGYNIIIVLFLDGHVKLQYFRNDFDEDTTDDYNDPSKDVYHDPTPGNGQSW